MILNFLPDFNDFRFTFAYSQLKFHCNGHLIFKWAAQVSCISKFCWVYKSVATEIQMTSWIKYKQKWMYWFYKRVSLTAALFVPRSHSFQPPSPTVWLWNMALILWQHIRAPDRKSLMNCLPKTDSTFRELTKQNSAQANNIKQKLDSSSMQCRCDPAATLHALHNCVTFYCRHTCVQMN
jgi:hypothetical protein